MIKREAINIPDAVEKLFCPAFSKLIPTQEIAMNKADAKTFLEVSHMPENLDEDPKQQEKLLKIPVYSHIEKMLETAFTFKCCFRTKFWIGYISQNEGIAMMYLTYVQYVAKKENNKQFVNFRLFCERMFPNGFPSNIELIKLFNHLKLEGTDNDNLLYYPSAKISLQFDKPFMSNVPVENGRSSITPNFDVMGALKNINFNKIKPK